MYSDCSAIPFLSKIYQKIVVSLGEAIRLMKQADEVIAAHGGWPIECA